MRNIWLQRWKPPAWDVTNFRRCGVWKRMMRTLEEKNAEVSECMEKTQGCPRICWFWRWRELWWIKEGGRTYGVTEPMHMKGYHIRKVEEMWLSRNRGWELGLWRTQKDREPGKFLITLEASQHSPWSQWNDENALCGPFSMWLLSHCCFLVRRQVSQAGRYHVVGIKKMLEEFRGI